MPKYLMGIPVDRWSAFLGRKLKLPTRLVRMIMAQLARLAIGNQERFGVRKPAHPMWREHATISQELLPYVGHGWIGIKPNVRELRGSEIAFDDGSVQPCDAVIYATGYRTTFPFIDPEQFAVGEETPQQHNLRLVTALAPWKVADWPWPGRIVIRENQAEGKWQEAHVFERWCHLGTARSEDDLQGLLECRAQIDFDPDIYKIVRDHVSKYRGSVRVIPRAAIPAEAELADWPS
jgi:hypothetical protein